MGIETLNGCVKEASLTGAAAAAYGFGKIYKGIYKRGPV